VCSSDLLNTFLRPILKKDKSTATITSSMGAAFGTAKFHKITPINQII
jgi:hypothetical protein